jgi:hypothetical protein
VFVVMALGMIWMATVGCYHDRNLLTTNSATRVFEFEVRDSRGYVLWRIVSGEGPLPREIRYGCRSARLPAGGPVAAWVSLQVSKGRIGDDRNLEGEGAPRPRVFRDGRANSARGVLGVYAEETTFGTLDAVRVRSPLIVPGSPAARGGRPMYLTVPARSPARPGRRSRSSRRRPGRRSSARPSSRRRGRLLPSRSRRSISP